ncbi:MAG: HlyD family efflux transporter periplasmic adaptor subunit, partial [Firmicutes bacterium]|nr:HlyD family efflux transporter periplasmic adaptor subunit [Bacillota bacterium]
AEKALADVRDALEKLTLRAPFDGTVLSVGAAVGEEIPAGSGQEPLIQLAASDQWSLLAYADEADITQIQIGQTVEIMFLAAEGRVFRGRVSGVGGTAKAGGDVASYPITIDLLDFASFFLPGMTADAEIITLRRSGVLVVPKSAVTVRRGAPSVQVPTEGEPTYRRVTTGAEAGGMVEIVEGLEEGDTILLPDNVRSVPQGSSTSPNNRQPQGFSPFQTTMPGFMRR